MSQLDSTRLHRKSPRNVFNWDSGLPGHSIRTKLVAITYVPGDAESLPWAAKTRKQTLSLKRFCSCVKSLFLVILFSISTVTWKDVPASSASYFLFWVWNGKHRDPELKGMSGHVTFLMCGRRFPLANLWGRNHCPQSSPMTIKGLKVQVFTRKRKMTTAAILKRVSIRTPGGFD